LQYVVFLSFVARGEYFCRRLVSGQPLGRAAPAFLGIAVIVAYSRVYIGIHYPFDVLGGAAIGLLIAGPCAA